MIRDHDEFESALHELANMLQSPPAPATAEDVRFGQLLDAVDAYMPAIADHPHRDTLAERAQALTAEAEAFKRKRDARDRSSRWTTLPEDGEGIGPTTGV
jgi:hypothetical protein